MDVLRRRTVRLISGAALGVAVITLPAIAIPNARTDIAICPNGMVDNPAGYGCIPYTPGLGAPTEEVLTSCHGNYYICVWPYPVP